jgi:hypothetical protein
VLAGLLLAGLVLTGLVSRLARLRRLTRLLLTGLLSGLAGLAGLLFTGVLFVRVDRLVAVTHDSVVLSMKG